MGDDLNLSLVRRLTFIHAHSASRITWHSHECYELLLLLDGATAYEFQNCNTVELPGGHFMVIPPGTLHRGCQDVRRPVRLTGIMFDPGVACVAPRSPFLSQELEWLEQQFLSGSLQAKRMSKELRKLVSSVELDLAAFDRSQVAQVASLRLTVSTILLEAAKQLVSVRTFAPQQTVQAAIDFMKSHLPATCSIEALAAAVHCSRAKLFDVFKESTGMTPNDYWQRLRIDHAQELLIQSDAPVIKIAMDCGFSTSQYFSTVFRKYSGVSPSLYRKEKKGHSPTRRNERSSDTNSR